MSGSKDQSRANRHFLAPQMGSWGSLRLSKPCFTLEPTATAGKACGKPGNGGGPNPIVARLLRGSFYSCWREEDR